jgi:murein DD-endopeptidase MepM/ murein hydrolase activator NlpD
MRSLAAVPFALVLLSTSSLAQSGQTRVDVMPGTAKPGDPLVVTVLGPVSDPQGTAGDRALHFYEIPGGYQAITGLPVELEPGPVAIQLSARDLSGAKPARMSLEATVDVLPPNYPSRELTVAKKFIQPPASVRARIKADQAAFKKALSQPFAPLLFVQDFAWPRPQNVTAHFGDLRVFNGKKQSQHYGTDIDGRVGEPILAADDGRVVMVRDAYSSGNSVILFHGAQLYSMYFHMSEVEVKPGELVKRGQLLGKVGSTGRVTGPHLHFGVKVDGLYVDPATLLSIPFSGYLGRPE